MNYFRLLLPVLLLASACTVHEDRLIPDNATEEPAEEKTISTAIIQVDDNLLAILEEASENGDDSALESLGIVGYKRVFPYEEEFEERTRHDGLHRFYEISFSEPQTRTKAGATLKSTEGIITVDLPGKIRKRSAIPNDPYFKWQWDMYNDKSLNLQCTKSNSKYGIEKFTNLGADMNLYDVWDMYTTGSSNVIVAVVDGGVELDHPDLAANCIAAGSNGSKNFVKNNYKITGDSHGTHVAGTIAAVRNNGVGVAGIAGGDYANGIGGVRIMSCQIFTEDDGASDANTAAAIKWGADHGAVISQNSWGYYADEDEDGSVSDSEYNSFKKDFPGIPTFIKSAVDYFIERAGCESTYPYNQKSDSPMKGGIVVFAAGNESIDYDPICDYEPIIAVGAGTAGYTRAYYSNYGSWVDICAPGGDALVYPYTNELDSKGYSRGEIYNLYCTTAIDGYDYTSYGYMSGTSMACPHISGALALLVSYFGGQGFTNEECKKLLMDGADDSYVSSTKYVGPWVDVASSFGLAASEGNTVPEKVSDYSLSVNRRDIQVDAVVPADAEDGKAYRIQVLCGTDKNAVSSSTPTNPATGVLSQQVLVGDAAAGETVSTTFSSLSYSTTYYFALYAADKSLSWSEVSDIKSATTPENHAPALVSQPAGVLIYGVGSSKVISLSNVFSDEDGDDITFSVVSENGNIATASISNTTSVRIRAVAGGVTNAVITATDGDKSGKCSIPVLVKLDASNPAEVLPQVVETSLTIRTEEEAETYVKIVSSTGSTVYESTSTFSGFDPLVLDLSGLAPGRYFVTIGYGGETYKKTIVKI